jgi:hypothetical protein
VQNASQALREPLPASDVDIAEDALGVDVNEGNEYESEGVELPDDSIVDTESSMSDGLGLGDEEYDDKDGDYVMETNLKSDEEEFEIEPAEVQHSRTKKASAVCSFMISHCTAGDTFSFIEISPWFLSSCSQCSTLRSTSHRLRKIKSFLQHCTETQARWGERRYSEVRPLILDE